MTSSVLRVGSGASELAMAYAAQAAARLGAHELVGIADEPESPGVLVGRLREALLRGDVDAVVHAASELPRVPADGIELVAMPKRADARDALCSADGARLVALAPGARVGTGSARRRAQLLATRPDLDIVAIGGDIATRLDLLTAPEADRRLDAVVLAAAGLDRLGRGEDAVERFGLSDWPASPAQGALAIEVRAGAPAGLLRRIAAIDHRPTRLAARAELAVLAHLEADATAPIGAYAQLEDGLLFLTATVYAPDGTDSITASHAAYPEDVRDPADALGERVAGELLERGAGDLAPGSRGGAS